MKQFSDKFLIMNIEVYPKEYYLGTQWSKTDGGHYFINMKKH